METTNYKLSLCDDATGNFIDWRKSINGSANSNMVKIDTALAGKADASRTVEAVLSASGWIGEAAPYTQVLTIEGLTDSTNGSISGSYSADAEQRDAMRNGMLSVSGQETGKITIAADGEKPSVDIPVTILILG